MIDPITIFKKKTEILCKGLYLDEKLKDQYNEQGIEIDFGRKGGAGPLGGRYFFFEDNSKTFVNAALWNDPNRTDLVLKGKVNGYFEVYNNSEKNIFCKLKLIEEPEFYKLKTSDGIPMKKIALMHGVDCLGSTVYQKCKYWGCGEGCEFCGIELSLKNDTTILEKTPQQLLEVITAAKKEGKCSHVTLTSGTTDDKDKGVNRYIEILKCIKSAHPDISLHVQIEPFEDLTYINKLKETGADTIGIHIEVLNDDIRRKVTPGKFKIPYQLFEDNWIHALKIFGRNQVETYILAGYEEDLDEFYKDLERVISLGVIPYITPVRSIPDINSTFKSINYKTLLDIYKRAAKMMKKYNVSPLENTAGCVLCGGCSAINEAYNSI